MQFRVPQNIAMEDRIVGPFTAIQFGILIIGGGLAFVVFQTTSINPVNKYLAGLIAVLTVTLAIGKFNDQPLFRFSKYILAFVFTPKVRVWHKEGSRSTLVKPSLNPTQEEAHHHKKQVSPAQIRHLAELLDTRGKQGSLPNLNPPPTKTTPETIASNPTPSPAHE